MTPYQNFVLPLNMRRKSKNNTHKPEIVKMAEREREREREGGGGEIERESKIVRDRKGGGWRKKLEIESLFYFSIILSSKAMASYKGL